MAENEIVILSGARTAIGGFGGSLASVAPIDLATTVTRAAMERAGVQPDQIGTVVFGHVINTEPRDMYLGRVAMLNAGIPDATPAMNVNRLCGSGAQAIVSAAQALMLGDADFAIAGGAESMSRGPYILPSMRHGAKMGDQSAVDMMVGALTCPMGTGHMGITAENVASEASVTREDQDAFALESQNRAARAIEEGRFKEQIVPVEIKTRKGTVTFDTDEHPKATSAEKLAGLRPAFKKDGGSVTAGNASGINDGAAALVLARAEAAEAAGLKPKARILGYAVAGVPARVMGNGPIPAVRKLMEQTGLSIGDFDVIESNEAFAAQALAVGKELGMDPAKVNPNGGAIALGHPVGATGAILTVKAMYELDRIDGKKALITMCIGGGQGIAIAIERI
ncbi:acetyl-CoA C-acyltransferase family protein [Paracoccus sp. Z118]|uniref:acetyl-CoA C-acyltransferase family protein n=1 Tax=Paracoccus sp. Z118 TaxID=2851017 RepID=UPI001C2C23A5|nr:acetyl-CoA C-acyltransferase family protein [Paracoccus sp. Z118]MBV0891068.1 acetyl-CoA C-acyltransferase family protein [Paracoccus sp. Z118]